MPAETTHRVLFVVGALLTAALLPAGLLRADTIIVKADGLATKIDGTIQSINAGEVVYIPLATDRRTSEPIDSVLQIKAPGEPELTAAEQTFADGKWEDAVRRYRRVVGFATVDWPKYRAAVRLMDAGGRCGQFEAQVEGFVELATLDPANAQNRLPAISGVKAEQLDAVIGGLEKAASRPDLTKDSAAVVKELLANIYLAKGDAANAARMVAAGAAAPVPPPRTYVHDNAGKFSKETIGQAEEIISGLRTKYDQELLVESFPDIPEPKRDEVLAKGADRFFEDWNAERRKVEGIDGVSVLICMDPLHIQIGATKGTAEKLFTAADCDELLRQLTDAVHDHQLDAALTSTASFVFKRIGEHSPKDAPAVFADPGDATRIVYVCDASGSMLNKMANLKDQLQMAVAALGPNQSFNIVFFQDEKCVALTSEELIAAGPDAKRSAYKFLDDVTTSGPTDPIPGLKLAFKQHPQLIYLLTDGDFPDNKAVKDTIRKLNAGHKATVNTIAFVTYQDTDTDFIELLREIAKESGGRFKHVVENKLNR
jgi:uncharacterized membrane protein YgcG